MFLSAHALKVPVLVHFLTDFFFMEFSNKGCVDSFNIMMVEAASLSNFDPGGWLFGFVRGVQGVDFEFADASAWSWTEVCTDNAAPLSRRERLFITFGRDTQFAFCEAKDDRSLNDSFALNAAPILMRECRRLERWWASSVMVSLFRFFCVIVWKEGEERLCALAGSEDVRRN